MHIREQHHLQTINEAAFTLFNHGSAVHQNHSTTLISCTAPSMKIIKQLWCNYTALMNYNIYFHTIHPSHHLLSTATFHCKSFWKSSMYTNENQSFPKSFSEVINFAYIFLIFSNNLSNCKKSGLHILLPFLKPPCSSPLQHSLILSTQLQSYHIPCKLCYQELFHCNF